MQQSKKLTLKQIEKFARLVKNNTQNDAVILALKEGLEFSSDEAKLVGIADPKRVVYNVRNGLGLVPLDGKVVTMRQSTKSGNAVYRYTFIRKALPKTKLR